MGVRSQGALRSSMTRKSMGMSLAVGICSGGGGQVEG